MAISKTAYWIVIIVVVVVDCYIQIFDCYMGFFNSRSNQVVTTTKMMMESIRPSKIKSVAPFGTPCMDKYTWYPKTNESKAF